MPDAAEVYIYPYCLKLIDIRSHISIHCLCSSSALRFQVDAICQIIDPNFSFFLSEIKLINQSLLLLSCLSQTSYIHDWFGVVSDTISCYYAHAAE